MFAGETFKDGRYTALCFLGEGHYSTVWRVRDELSGEHCAMKVRLGGRCAGCLWCAAGCCCC